MRISTLIKIVEKHFLDGRKLSTQEQSLLALVANVRIHDKTKEEFATISADDLEDIIKTAKENAKNYYLAKAKEFD